MPERTQRATWAAWLAFLLIAIGACRIAAVVGATPLLGYANQFDMRRISACVGLWPDAPAVARLEAHPEAPVSRYIRGERRPDECYWSSELLFVAPLVASMSDGEIADLRFVGALKAVTLVAVAIALGVLFRRRPGLALIHGLIFAAVIGDPMVTLWLNTLYTEFAALLFAYASVALLVFVGTCEQASLPPSPLHWGALALCLVGLGLSRQQHMLLPALLVVPLVVSLWGPARRGAFLLIVLVSTIAFAQAALLPRHPTIAQANNADVVLGAILPASRDEALTARRLGLPDRCLRSVGATWYEPMGEALESACPEALALPKWRIAALIATEPQTLLRAAFRALPQLQDWRLGYLGSVEGERYAGNDEVRAVAGPLAASVAPTVAAMAPLTFLQSLVASIAIFLLSLGICISAISHRRSSALALTMYALTVIAWYAILTSIFGDGYVEVARHAHLASVAFYAAGVVLASMLLQPLLRRLGLAGGGRSFAKAGFALAAIAAALLSRWPLQLAMEAVPMAFGVVDRPVRNSVAGDDTEFAGWAIDPLGVSRVELVVVGSATLPVRYGLTYHGVRGEPLSLYFPAYPKTGNAGFSAIVPARLLSGGGAEVRTVVVNEAGVRTEIDRRHLTHGGN